MPSLLDPGQIIKRLYDEDKNAIRVDAQVVATMSGDQEIVISQVDDSIRLGDGTNLITATIVGSDTGLDVNIVGGVVTGNFSSSGLSTGLSSTSIIITDIPTRIPGIGLDNRNGLSIRVWGSNIIYFGNDSVTTDNGYPKRQFEEMVLDVKNNSEVEIYGVCSNGQTCEVRILEIA